MTGLFTPGSVAVSAAVAVGWMLLGAHLDEKDRAILQVEHATALCLPAPGEIAHLAPEEGGGYRCSITRRGQLVTRLVLAPASIR